jgi:hypothetical protein
LGIITLTAIEKPRFGISLAPRGKSEKASHKANRKSQKAKVKSPLTKNPRFSFHLRLSSGTHLPLTYAF